MALSKSQSLWTSVILHIAVLIALFLATIVETFLPKDKPHVFEMVSEQQRPANSGQSSAIPMETPPVFEIPDVPPMNIPDPVMPAPAEIPAPPTPAPVKPTPAPVKPAPTPTPAPPKLMSLDDFRKDNPLKPAKPTPPQPTRTVTPPKIDTSKYSKNLQDNLPTTVHTPSGGSLTAAERTALQRYGDQLNGRLNRAWVKPANLAGVGLVVTVVFDVSSSGAISNIRLRPASGNSAFDASVKAAFSRVGSGGVTPTGQGHSFTMTFKMVD